MIMDSLWKRLKDFFYGFAFYGMVREVTARKREEEDAFALLAAGDVLGLQVGPPYYRLRLLPYLMPGLARWKERMLRPKDLFHMAQE